MSIAQSACVWHLKRRLGFWKALHVERDLGSCFDILSFGASLTRALLSQASVGLVMSSLTRVILSSLTLREAWLRCRPSQEKGIHVLWIKLYRGIWRRGECPLSRGQYCALIKGNGMMGEPKVLGSAFGPQAGLLGTFACGRPRTAPLVGRPWDTGQSKNLYFDPVIPLWVQGVWLFRLFKGRRSILVCSSLLWASGDRKGSSCGIWDVQWLRQQHKTCATNSEKISSRSYQARGEGISHTFLYLAIKWHCEKRWIHSMLQVRKQSLCGCVMGQGHQDLWYRGNEDLNSGVPIPEFCCPYPWCPATLKALSFSSRLNGRSK